MLRAAFRRPGLRSLTLVYSCFKTAELGAWIAITTVAYVEGGVNLATAVLVVQLAPATVAALKVDRAIVRRGPVHVLVAGLVVQAAGLALVSTALLLDAPFGFAVLGAILAATAVVTTRPALQTLLPSVVEEPHELTAANSVLGWILGAATLIGPIATAATYAPLGRWAPFMLFAALDGFAAALAVRLRGATTREGSDHALAEASVDIDEDAGAGSSNSRAIWLTLLVIGAGGFLWGAIDLVEAVVAIDLTGGPPTRAAVMAAAFGAGALVGGLSTVVLIGRRHLWPAMATAAVLTGLTTAATGAARNPLVAGGLLALVGASSTAMVVAARSLLQRISDFATVCRAFSLAEATEMGTLLAGSIAVPLLVALLGARWAPVAVGLTVTVAALLAARSVAAAEAEVAGQVERLLALRRTPLLSGLPSATLELLARQSSRRVVQDGSTIIREGEIGDRFYVVESGTVRASRGDVELRRMRTGDGFGEIALLLDSPRTATVSAEGDVTLLVVDRSVFLTAVTGHAAGYRHLHQLARRHAADDYDDSAS